MICTVCGKLPVQENSATTVSFYGACCMSEVVRNAQLNSAITAETHERPVPQPVISCGAQNLPELNSVVSVNVCMMPDSGGEAYVHSKQSNM